MKSQEKNPRFAVLIADENLDFKKHVLDDPKVLGRQLIEVAGGHPVDEHVAICHSAQWRLRRHSARRKL